MASNPRPLPPGTWADFTYLQQRGCLPFVAADASEGLVATGREAALEHLAANCSVRGSSYVGVRNHLVKVGMPLEYEGADGVVEHCRVWGPPHRGLMVLLNEDNVVIFADPRDCRVPVPTSEED